MLATWVILIDMLCDSNTGTINIQGEGKYIQFYSIHDYYHIFTMSNYGKKYRNEWHIIIYIRFFKCY